VRRLLFFTLFCRLRLRRGCGLIAYLKSASPEFAREPISSGAKATQAAAQRNWVCRSLNHGAIFVPVIVGNPCHTKLLSDMLLGQQWASTSSPINFPTVPRGTERLRFSAVAGKTTDPLEMDALVTCNGRAMGRNCGAKSCRSSRLNIPLNIAKLICAVVGKLIIKT